MHLQTGKLTYVPLNSLFLAHDYKTEFYSYQKRANTLEVPQKQLKLLKLLPSKSSALNTHPSNFKHRERMWNEL